MSCGKQVLQSALGLLNVEWHDYAQARDTEAAVKIANALNAYHGAVDVPCDLCKLVGAHVPTCENGRATVKCEPTSDASAKPDT